jgi:ATP synthase proteolipid subunit
MGAAYGTAKSGVAVAFMGVMLPELVMKSIVPVIMAGVLGIYGLIIAIAEVSRCCHAHHLLDRSLKRGKVSSGRKR